MSPESQEKVEHNEIRSTKSGKLQKAHADTTPNNSLESPEQDSSAFIDPSAREVAGDVRQSSNGTIAAEPPPTVVSTNRQRSNRSQRHSRQERRNSRRPQGDDGSESDEDQKKPGRDNNVDDRSTAKRTEQPEDKANSISVNKVVRRIEDFHRNKNSNSHISDVDKDRIIYWALCKASKPDWIYPSQNDVDDVIEQNFLLQKFLDNALHSDILDTIGEDHEGAADGTVQDDFSDPEQTARAVQLAFLRQYPIKFPSDRVEPRERLIYLVNYMWVRVDNYYSSSRQLMRERDAFSDWNVFRSYFPTPRSRDLPARIAPIVKDFYRKVSTEVSLSFTSSGNATLLKFQWESYLTNDDAYLRWILGDTWFRELHGRLVVPIKSFHQSLDSTLVNIKQDLFLDLVKPSLVSLVLFKDGYPTTIQDVSSEELRRIGWTASQIGYYRYELESNLLFRVLMDGQLLGVVGQDGKCIPVHEVYLRLKSGDTQDGQKS